MKEMVSDMDSDEKEILKKKRKEITQKMSSSEEDKRINGEPIHFTAETFQETINKADVPVFVDFWAPWCAPCRVMAPIIEDLAEKFEEEVIVGKLNLEEGANQKIAQNFQISGIPTFILFKGGKPVEKIVGGRKRESLINTIKKHL